MKIVMLCICGFEWSTAHGARTVKVTVVTPEYVPPCPTCGEKQVKVIITQERDDLAGTLQITSTGKADATL